MTEDAVDVAALSVAEDAEATASRENTAQVGGQPADAVQPVFAGLESPVSDGVADG